MSSPESKCVHATFSQQDTESHATPSPTQASAAAAYAIRIVSSGGTGVGFLSGWASSPAPEAGKESTTANGNVRGSVAWLVPRSLLAPCACGPRLLRSLRSAATLRRPPQAQGKKEHSAKDDRTCPWPAALEITGTTVVNAVADTAASLRDQMITPPPTPPWVDKQARRSSRAKGDPVPSICNAYLSPSLPTALR